MDCELRSLGRLLVDEVELAETVMILEVVEDPMLMEFEGELVL